MSKVAALCLPLLMLFSQRAAGQTPDNLGTSIFTGSYTSYTMNTVGDFKQYRAQATSSSGNSWEFYSCNTACYYYVWRPYNGGQTIAGFNQNIPAGAAASALYNNDYGGVTGLVPAITSGDYYTVNVSNNAVANNNMAVLQTTYNPVTITSVSSDQSSYYLEAAPIITVKTSASPNAGEYIYVRYSSTSNFASSSLTAVNFSGTTGTATLPAQTSTYSLLLCFFPVLFPRVQALAQPTICLRLTLITTAQAQIIIMAVITALR